MLAACAAACAVAALSSSTQRRGTPPAAAGLYDSDPAHLWNRIHRLLHVRAAPDGQQYGFDNLDPLLWRETRYLLIGPSQTQAISLLDEFLASGAERLIGDPLKRAVFQHDLWAVFDWLTVTSNGEPRARQTLMTRIVRVMRRVALTRTQIEALPDTYAAAVASGGFAPANREEAEPSFPIELSRADGPWIPLAGTQSFVPQHSYELGRSAFIVMWSVPGGSIPTFDYLKRLWEHPQPFVPDESFSLARDGEARVKINPALPPVPDGTRIALVRKMMLIDDQGVVLPTRIVQSIQLRTFRGNRHLFAEWQMSRQQLLAARSSGLRRIAADDQGFLTFSAKGMDPFEREPTRTRARPSSVLATCPMCHQTEFGPAIESIRSLRAILRPNTLSDPRHERWSRWFTQPVLAAEAKSRTYEWGVLRALWTTQAR